MSDFPSQARPGPKGITQLNYVIMYSGGVASYEAARRVIAYEGKTNVVLLFADTLVEDPDLYRFVDQTRELLGVPLVRLCEGRTPWQVFHDVKFIGNSRVDPCSKILKRDLCDKWLNENRSRRDTVVVLGLDWTETHRIAGAEARYAKMGWQTSYPLNARPLFRKEPVLAELAEWGIEMPKLYRLGFAHNNCGGFCIKAGMKHFEQLLTHLPEVYAENEAQEEAVRQHIGKDVSVMKDRRGGKPKPITMKAFRERVQAKAIEVDPTDIGGCGCFSEGEEE